MVKILNPYFLPLIKGLLCKCLLAQFYLGLGWGMQCFLIAEQSCYCKTAWGVLLMAIWSMLLQPMAMQEVCHQPHKGRVEWARVERGGTAVPGWKEGGEVYRGSISRTHMCQCPKPSICFTATITSLRLTPQQVYIWGVPWQWWRFPQGKEAKVQHLLWVEVHLLWVDLSKCLHARGYCTRSVGLAASVGRLESNWGFLYIVDEPCLWAWLYLLVICLKISFEKLKSLHVIHGYRQKLIP